MIDISSSYSFEENKNNQYIYFHLAVIPTFLRDTVAVSWKAMLVVDAPHSAAKPLDTQVTVAAEGEEIRNGRGKKTNESI